MLMIQMSQVDNYMDLERAVSELEEAAGMRLEKLTYLFLKGYTLKAPEPPKFDALERMASDA
jgi:hypothetical protein